MEHNMTITRDVINDLLPVYLAGDASADTRALVERFLAADPTLAADVRAHAERGAALLQTLSASPQLTAPDAEVATFERIRKHNRDRNSFLAFGIAFALVPFAFTFGDGHIHWLMLRNSPKQALIFLAASAYCWISFAILTRRQRPQAR